MYKCAASVCSSPWTDPNTPEGKQMKRKGESKCQLVRSAYSNQKFSKVWPTGSQRFGLSEQNSYLATSRDRIACMFWATSLLISQNICRLQQLQAPYKLTCVWSTNIQQIGNGTRTEVDFSPRQLQVTKSFSFFWELKRNLMEWILCNSFQFFWEMTDLYSSHVWRIFV